MKKYILTEYQGYDDDEPFKCLFRFENLIELKQSDEKNKKYYEDHSHRYDIKEVIGIEEGKNLIFEKSEDGKSVLWGWPYNKERNPGLVLLNEELIIMEFPDDDSAKLWFNLKYGG